MIKRLEINQASFYVVNYTPWFNQRLPGNPIGFLEAGVIGCRTRCWHVWTNQPQGTMAPRVAYWLLIRNYVIILHCNSTFYFLTRFWSDFRWNSKSLKIVPEHVTLQLFFNIGNKVGALWQVKLFESLFAYNDGRRDGPYLHLACRLSGPYNVS